MFIDSSLVINVHVINVCMWTWLSMHTELCSSARCPGYFFNSQVTGSVCHILNMFFSFTDDQLRNLSEILDQVTNYHDQYDSDIDRSKAETTLDQVLNTTKIIVNNPIHADKILRSQEYSASLLSPAHSPTVGGSIADSSYK